MNFEIPPFKMNNYMFSSIFTEKATIPIIQIQNIFQHPEKKPYPHLLSVPILPLPFSYAKRPLIKFPPIDLLLPWTFNLPLRPN